MRTHTYKPKYSHSTSRTIAQKKKDSRPKGYREILDAEEREWNAEEAIGEWGSMSANVMRTLESGVTQPERGRRFRHSNLRSYDRFFSQFRNIITIYH